MEDLQFLEKCKGQGTSLVSLIRKAGTQPGDVSRYVTEELSAASNIKSRTNRQGVQRALRSVQAYVKGMRNFSGNGVAIFAGQYV